MNFCILVSACGPVSARVEPAPFRLVFDVLSAPNIFTMTWGNLLKQLDPWCAPSPRSGIELIAHGNVECKPEVHALAVTISSDGEGRIGMVEALFNGAAACEYMTRKLTETFGPPKTTKVRACKSGV